MVTDPYWRPSSLLSETLASGAVSRSMLVSIPAAPGRSRSTQPPEGSTSRVAATHSAPGPVSSGRGGPPHLGGQRSAAGVSGSASEPPTARPRNRHHPQQPPTPPIQRTRWRMVLIAHLTSALFRTAAQRDGSKRKLVNVMIGIIDDAGINVTTCVGIR